MAAKFEDLCAIVPVAHLECEGDGLEAGRVAAKLEDPGQLEDAKDLEDLVEAATLLFLVVPREGKGVADKSRISSIVHSRLSDNETRSDNRKVNMS